MSGARLPRHRRAETPPPMLLTERDIEILRTVAEFRYMTREQVEKLFFSPSTTSYCKRRLSLLYHNGYLERRFLPLRQAFGAARAYYVLDQKGAEVVCETTGRTRQELDWRPRDGRREPLYMEHTLAINDVRAIAALTAQRRGIDLAWTDERELKRRVREHRVPDPTAPDRKITIVPDGYFVIQHRWAFALELDRATVEEQPFKRKVRGYGEWKRSGAYARSLGTHSLRVLFVVADERRDPRRLERIRDWTVAAGGGTMFWFARQADLTGSDMFANASWAVARAEGRRRLFGGEIDELGDPRRNA